MGDFVSRIGVAFSLCSAVGVTTFVLGSASVSLANQTVFTPKLIAQTTYDDNAFFDDEEDTIFLLKPSFTLSYGEENWSFDSGGHVALYRYESLDEYDRENYHIWFGGDRNITERLQFGVRASYDYDNTFEDELTESGYITQPTLRERYNVIPDFSYQLSERDSLSFSLPLQFITYEDKVNPNSDSYGGVFSWSRMLSNQKSSFLTQFSYNKYLFDRSDGETDQDVYTALFGMSYKPTERLDLRGLIGVGRAVSNVDFDGMADVDQKDTYFSFDLSGTYLWERWKLTLGADRQASPSTYGELTLRTRGTATANYSFTERFAGDLSGAYYHTETAGLVSEEKKRTYYIRPQLIYKMTENSRLRLEYKYTSVNNEITDDVDRQNRISLQFDYQYPMNF